MKNLRTIILLMTVILCFGSFRQIINFAQEESPNTLVDKLERTKIEDTTKKLSQKELGEIVKLITTSYIEIVRQKQSDYISLQTPLYLLLKTNYPNIKEREEERGISVGNIVKFLNSKPENTEIINSILIAQKNRKCS